MLSTAASRPRSRDGAPRVPIQRRASLIPPPATHKATYPPPTQTPAAPISPGCSAAHPPSNTAPPPPPHPEPEPPPAPCNIPSPETPAASLRHTTPQTNSPDAYTSAPRSP